MIRQAFAKYESLVTGKSNNPHAEKLDRLSRSLKDLLMILECVQSAGAGFRSMTEAVDTTIPAGRMMMQMLGAFAEFERAMIRERTCSGLASARAKGRAGGHRPKLTADQRQEAMQMIGSGQKSAADVARLFKVHPAAVSRLLAQSTVARPGSRRTRAAGV